MTAPTELRARPYTAILRKRVAENPFSPVSFSAAMKAFETKAAEEKTTP